MKITKFEKVFAGWFVFVGLLSVGAAGFSIWVIVKVMQHFGVI